MKHLFWSWRVVMKSLCFLVFGVGSLVLGVFVFPAILILGRSDEKKDKMMRHLIHISSAAFVLLMRSLGLINVDWSGDVEKIQDGTGKLLIANHPSLIDIVILMARIRNADCIIKSSLFRFPFVRHVVRKLYISNELTDIELVDAGVRSINSGKTLVIFPEGTRSGKEGMKPVKRGAARIALKGGFETLPVRIESQDVTGLRKNDGMLTYRKDGAIDFHMRIIPPIQSRDFDGLTPGIAARRLTGRYLGKILG